MTILHKLKIKNKQQKEHLCIMHCDMFVINKLHTVKNIDKKF